MKAKVQQSQGQSFAALWQELRGNNEKAVRGRKKFYCDRDDDRARHRER